MAIGDTASGYTFGIDLGKFRVETVERVSGPGIDRDVVEIKQATPTGRLATKQSGPSQTDVVTITRGMDRSKAFTDWIESASATGNQNAARQNLTVTVMDNKRKPVKRIHLSRAWVSNFQGTTFEAGTNGPPTETVTVSYEEIKVEKV